MGKFLVPAVVVIFSALLLANLASAQVPTSGNAFFGYSYLNADLSSSGRSNFDGWNASLEGKVFPHIGMVADFGETYGSAGATILCPGPPCPIEPRSAHEYNVLFGPRVYVSVGKLRPFGEALFGVAHASVANIGSDTSFDWALGGGVDYRIIKPIAVRVEGDYLGTRFFSSTQGNFRFSTGLVLRF